MQEIKCLACNKKFKAKRSTATFCSESCRSNYHQKKQRRERQLTQLRKEEKDCQSTLEQARNKLALAQIQVKYHESQVAPIEERAKEVKRLLALDNATLAADNQWVNIFKVTAMPYLIKPNWMTALCSGYMAYKLFQRTPEIMMRIRQALEQEADSLQYALFGPRMELANYLKAVGQYKKTCEQQKNSLSEIQSKIRTIDMELAVAQKRKQRVSLLAYEQNHKVNGSKGVKVSELLKMRFNTFTLSGNIGKFLGELERYKLAIGLSGDPGTGKSYFSVSLAKTFSSKDLTVAYYSLEMGIGRKLQNAMEHYDVDGMVDVFDNPSLEDVKEKAEMYDVVIVDSFVKLNCYAIELDNLRHEFPKTIFIFILQKNAQGQNRGGSALDYDADMVMDLIFDKEGKRQVYMKKSRYGTTGWRYFPESDTVIPAGQ